MNYPGYSTFTYEGPVLEFGKVISTSWKASTYAPSEKKARSNLTYQFKKQFGKTPTCKITLPGELKKLG